MERSHLGVKAWGNPTAPFCSQTTPTPMLYPRPSSTLLLLPAAHAQPQVPPGVQFCLVVMMCQELVFLALYMYVVTGGRRGRSGNNSEAGLGLRTCPRCRPSPSFSAHSPPLPAAGYSSRFSATSAPERQPHWVSLAGRRHGGRLRGAGPINPASLPPGDPQLIALILEQLKSRRPVRQLPQGLPFLARLLPLLTRWFPVQANPSA